MKTLQDKRNELLDYLQENEVSLKIIKKISKELEKQDKEFIKETSNKIDKRLKEIESAIKGGVNFKLEHKGKNVSATLKTLRFFYKELNKIKEIIKQNSGFEE